MNNTLVNLANVILNVLMLVSAYLSGLIIDKSGRKSVLLYGEVFCAILLGLTALFSLEEWNAYCVALFIILYCTSFGMSLGPIVWMYMPEIVPFKAVSLASSFNWLCSAILGLFFDTM